MILGKSVAGGCVEAVAVHVAPGVRLAPKASTNSAHRSVRFGRESDQAVAGHIYEARSVARKRGSAYQHGQRLRRTSWAKV